MRKFLTFIFSAAMIFALSGCDFLPAIPNFPIVQKPNPEAPSTELPEGSGEVATYSIIYQWGEGEERRTIPAYMWSPEGNYPEEYEVGKATTVSALRDYQKDENTLYIFEGWYYDSGYQAAMQNNQIEATKTGTVTLYAKIDEQITQKVISFVTYKWLDCGTVKDGLPTVATMGLVLPSEYEEGICVSLPQLKTWKQNERATYEFEGWYYDEALTKKVSENEISEESTGNVVLYANFIVWIK